MEVIANNGTHAPPAGVPIAQYEYNGLHWRTIKRADADDAELGIDQERVLYYDASWRLIEERIDDGWDPDAEPLVHEDNRSAQQFWGLRYLDDAAIRRVRAYVNTAAPEDPPSFAWTDWEHFWYVTDAQFSVVALLDDVGNVVERVSYDAYGNARQRRPADLDGDGDVDTPDLSAYPSSSDYFIGDSGYSADFDLNRDGSEDDVFDYLDYLDWWFPGNGHAAVPDGHISETDAAAIPNVAVAPDNPIGYCGYVFNPEAQLYLARNRWYSPELGRWLERDPAGYVGGANLYGYVGGGPLVFVDPYGLEDWMLSNWIGRQTGMYGVAGGVDVFIDMTVDNVVAVATFPYSQAHDAVNGVAGVVAETKADTEARYGPDADALDYAEVGLAKVTPIEKGVEAALGVDASTGEALSALDRASRAFELLADGLLAAAGGLECRAAIGEKVAKEATEEAAKEGIYEFTAASGKQYVGQTSNFTKRIAKHLATGKLKPADLGSLRTTEVLGGKTAREVAEQLRILELGGVGNLENIRNPIGPARSHLLPQWARDALGHR